MKNFIVDSSEVMPAIQDVINGITEAQLNRMGAKLDEQEKKEDVVGMLHSELARRLWCVYTQAHTKAAELLLRSKTADTDEQEKELLTDSKRWHSLSDISEAMFWYEVRQSMSCWNGNIGIRRGWVVVTRTEQENGNMPPFLRHLLGGGKPE